MIDDLSKYWKEAIKSYLYVDKNGLTTNSIEIRNFNSKGISIIFQDDSHASFKYAFYLENKIEYAIFTEHCGFFVINKSVVVSISSND